MAATAVGLDLDLDFSTIREGCWTSRGGPAVPGPRRSRGVLVVDDYAHHPVEIQATLNAAKAGFNRNLIAVFQPHRYTRTQALCRSSSRLLPGGPAVRDRDLRGRESPCPG